MADNRQYQSMLSSAREKLAGRDPRELADAAGIRWTGEAFEAESFGQTFRITRPEFAFIPEPDMWQALSVLNYIAEAKGSVPTGRFLALSDFADGGLVRGSSFDRENDRLFARIGTYGPEAIRKAAGCLGGESFGGKGDLCFRFFFLPSVPMLFSLWLADEEFPASGKVLFDRSAEGSLPVENAGTVAGILLQRILDLLLQDPADEGQAF